MRLDVIRRRPFRALVPTAIAALVAGAAAMPTRGAEAFPYRPEPPAPGWQTAAPGAVALDAQRLAVALQRLTPLPGIECILVARSGHLVAEIGGGGDGCRRPHNIQSASKSVLSLLVGIALGEGQLPGVDRPLQELLPERTAGFADARRAITLEQLLTMQSGLATTSGGAYGAWVATEDWSRAALTRPLERQPGTGFTYSTGNSHLIAAILRRAVGYDLLAWSNRVLFDPLGVGIDGWDRSPEGIRFGGNGFAVTALELLRLGQLVLDQGRHGARQLVPEDWLRHSLQVRSEGWPDRYGAYGYLWWLRPHSDPAAVLAVGYGGQFLYLVSTLDLAVVITADHRGKGAAWDRRVLSEIETGIVAAVTAD